MEIPSYNYTDAEFKKYRAHVYMCASYSTRTATDILVYHKCRLFSAGKIRALVDEFMKDRKETEEKNIVLPNTPAVATHLPATDHTRTMILLQIIKRLPSYARIGGGMMICALAKYLTAEQWEDELEHIENSQDLQVLWIEQFVRASIILREDCSSTDSRINSQVNAIIESEAEKMPLRLSFMRNDEYVELTFVD